MDGIGPILLPFIGMAILAALRAVLHRIRMDAANAPPEPIPDAPRPGEAIEAYYRRMEEGDLLLQMTSPRAAYGRRVDSLSEAMDALSEKEGHGGRD